MPSASRSRFPSTSPPQSSASLSSGNATSHSRSSSGSSLGHGPALIQLHYFLQKTQEVVAHDIRTYILWDIREHPRKAQTVSQLPLPIPSEVLNAYATNPPVAYINVTCEYPKPWSTVVHASGANQSGGFPQNRATAGVTVADLLGAIYNHARTHPVSTSEFNALLPKQQTRVLDAYEKRRKVVNTNQVIPGNSTASSRRNAAPPAGEGIKLVDTFLMHTMFAGLEVDLNNACTVNLSVKRPN
ncbi:hypothetical protein D9756_006718 [Leucocoprinus leucothites]|uniref:DUF6699 domain-containing protein n=1 Tax=Leucocoprinus leucothites TaxID=201217 RepID=A0A8H5G2I3_9AGAR|nr:hypothetical protein D9756_006718 [Leucoagaricus leucothites]